MFDNRSVCIDCGSRALTLLDSGSFDSEPVASFIRSTPWGMDPLPFLGNHPWALVKCDECSLTFHSYVLNAEWSDRLYREWVTQDAMVEFNRRLDLSRHDKLLRGRSKIENAVGIYMNARRLPIGESPVRVLDFGCGWGEFVFICRVLGIDAVGVDRSEARRSASAVPVFPALNDLPSPVGFHAITMFEVLEHLEAPSDVVESLVARLVTGGIMVVEVPNGSGLTKIRSQREFDLAHPLSHINVFNSKTLAAFMERRGLKRIPRPFVCLRGSWSGVVRAVVRRALRVDQRGTRQFFVKL